MGKEAPTYAERSDYDALIDLLTDDEIPDGNITERDELKETLKNRTCKNVDRLASRGFFTCSECGMGGEHGIPNFCSNCGAKVLESKR